MTKKEFDVETDLDNLLKTTTSDRKLRLFAVACCREIQHLMKDERSIKTVDVAELFADKLATQQELNAANDVAWAAASAAANDAAWAAASAAAWAAASAVAWYAASDAARAAARYAAMYATSNQQIKLFKDIVNPYSKPINLTILSWNSNIILHIAQTFYNTKNFNDMFILADALEEAGCIDLDILSHCRNNDVHVKGCWVVDLILGKS